MCFECCCKARWADCPNGVSLEKVYETGGYGAITQRTPGRPKGGSKLSQASLAHLKEKLLSERTGSARTSQALAQQLKDQGDATPNERKVIRRLADRDLLPPPHATNRMCHRYPKQDTVVLWVHGQKSEVYPLVCPLPVLDTDYLRLVQTLYQTHPKGLALKVEGHGFPGMRYAPKLAYYMNPHPKISLVIREHLEP